MSRNKSWIFYKSMSPIGPRGERERSRKIRWQWWQTNLLKTLLKFSMESCLLMLCWCWWIWVVVHLMELIRSECWHVWFLPWKCVVSVYTYTQIQLYNISVTFKWVWLCLLLTVVSFPPLQGVTFPCIFIGTGIQRTGVWESHFCSIIHVIVQ